MSSYPFICFMIIIVYILRYVKVRSLHSKEQFDEKRGTLCAHMNTDCLLTSHEWRKDAYCDYDKRNIYIRGEL